MAWVFLMLAGVFEILFTTAMRSLPGSSRHQLAARGSEAG